MKLSELFTKYDWCQGCAARDIMGNKVSTQNKEAYSFCLYGAIIKLHYLEHTTQYKIESKFRELIGTVPEWNDKPHRTKEEVLELIKRYEDATK